MQIWRYVVIVFTVFAGLVGCQTTEPVPPATTADEFVPLAMNARRLEIIDNWQMPVEAPYIGHRAQTLPSNLLAKWASQVLQPAGGSGELVFDISRASVTRVALPLEAGIKTLMTDQQESKIRVDIVTKLMWIQPVGGKQGIVDVIASTTRTLSESKTPNERQIAVREVMIEAVNLLDIEARKQITNIAEIIRP